MITSIATELTNEGANNQTGLGDLGSDTFLKLLVAQLQNQNPLEPMDGSQMLQQTATFSQVEAMQRLTDLQGRLLGVQNFSAAASLIGKEITAFVPGEGDVAGIVDSVGSGETGALLRVDGRDISLEHVVRVDVVPGEDE